VQCGYHLKKGKHLKTVHGTSRESGTLWDADLGGRSGWGRLGMGVLFQVILCVMPLVSEQLPKKTVGGVEVRPTADPSHHGAVLMIAVGTPLTWVLVGTYTRIRIGRDRQGRPVLLRSFRILYIPLGNRGYWLRHYKALWPDYRPPRRWWYRQPERFWLYLGGDTREEIPLVLIFRGGNDNRMRELCDLLKETAGLTVRPL